jgi:hypothetical protein
MSEQRPETDKRRLPSSILMLKNWVSRRYGREGQEPLGASFVTNFLSAPGCRNEETEIELSGKAIKISLNSLPFGNGKQWEFLMESE